MIYKFKSKASGDILMMAPNGDALMRILGREPAAQGIIEPAAMAAAITAIELAVAADEAARARSKTDARADAQTAAQAAALAAAQADAEDNGEATPARGDGVGLRQRLWPMVDMLKRCAAANEPVVWGV